MSSSNMEEWMAEILKFVKCLALQHFNDVNVTIFLLYSLLWYILEYVLKSFSIH